MGTTERQAYITWIPHSAIFFPRWVWLHSWLNRDWWYSTSGRNFVSPRTFLFLQLLWGNAEVFQILHGHTQRMRGSRAETLSCVTLGSPPLLPLPHCVSFFSPSLYLTMCWDFVHRSLRENPLRRQNSLFRGSISKIHSCARQLTHKVLIKLDH